MVGAGTYEIWKSDGSTLGTQRVTTNTGVGPTQPKLLTAVGTDIYFSALAGTSQSKRELWRTDGTPSGTYVVTDLSPLSAGSAPIILGYANQKLFLSATDGFRGFEPYVLNLAETSPPAISAASGLYELIPTIVVEFDEVLDPRSIANTDLIAQNLTDATNTASTSSSLSSNGRTITFTFAGGLPDGRYRFRLPAGAVSDVFGNATSADLFYETMETFILAGDINRDRTVNFDDLLILAQNYGQTGRTYSQGNVNYSADGAVDFDDLLILAQKYGSSLLSASAIALPAAKKKSTGRSADLLN